MCYNCYKSTNIESLIQIIDSLLYKIRRSEVTNDYKRTAGTRNALEMYKNLMIVIDQSQIT